MVKFIGIQVLGIIFGLAMLFISYIYMKRNDLNLNDFILWAVAWILFVTVIIFPRTVDIFVKPLRVQGALTLMTILGFMFVFVIVFYLFVAVRKNQKRINELIKNFALRERYKERDKAKHEYKNKLEHEKKQEEKKHEPHYYNRP